MLGALVIRFRDIHILFRDDIRIFFAHVGQAFVGDLLDLVFRLRLVIAFAQFRIINDGKNLSCLDDVALVYGNAF